MFELENPRKATNRFHFAGMETQSALADLAEIERKANLKLIQLLAFAPPGAAAWGSLEKVKNGYVASVEVNSSFRTFSAQGFATRPETAIDRALSKIEDQIFQWRFGGASPTPSGFGQRLMGGPTSLRSGY